MDSWCKNPKIDAVHSRKQHWGRYYLLTITDLSPPKCEIHSFGIHWRQPKQQKAPLLWYGKPNGVKTPPFLIIYTLYIIFERHRRLVQITRARVRHNRGKLSSLNIGASRQAVPLYFSAKYFIFKTGPKTINYAKKSPVFSPRRASTSAQHRKPKMKYGSPFFKSRTGRVERPDWLPWGQLKSYRGCWKRYFPKGLVLTQRKI